MKFLQRRILKTIQYSLSGLGQAWNNEEAFRIEIVLGIPLLIYAITSNHIITHKVLLCSSVLTVLIVELLNTGLEKTIDRISTDYHQLSKTVKDMGSAAVFIAILNFFITWVLILI